jgi:hypothetical protein
MNALQFRWPAQRIGHIAVMGLAVAPLLGAFAFMTGYPVFLRTIVVGLLALYLWWFPFLYEVSSGRVQIINTQNLMAMGFTLLFVVPGIYIAANADVFEAVRDQYTDYYPQALALISIAGGAFIGGFFAARDLLRRVPSGKLEERSVSSSALNVMLITMLTIIWCARIYLLSTGTYYHTLRTDFQEENYGVLAVLYTLESIGGVVVMVAIIQGLCGRWQGRAIFLMAIVGADILWYLAAAQKASVFRVVFALVVCLLLYREISRRNRWLLAGGVFAVIIILIPLMNAYIRVLNIVQHDPTEIVGISGTLDNVAEAFSIVGESRLGPFDDAMQRLGDIRSLGAVYYAVPSHVNYIWGESYLGILFAFVPHFLWPGKPDFEIRLELMREILPLQTIASSPLTLVGEAFVNFSYGGIVGVFFLVGVLAQIFNYFVVDRATVNPWYGALIAVEGSRIIWTSMILGQVITPLLRILVVAVIFSHLLQDGRRCRDVA